MAQGGAAFNPLTSFTYRPVGVNVEITPRVTFEGDIILELLIENSALGEGLNVAGQNLPSFTSRKVVTKLRLRDGESNLLAGLLQEEERRSLRGFPGILRLPIIKQLFSANDNTIGQTDIVMLLTPRIVRTHELTAQRSDARSSSARSRTSALSGPPPVIGQDPADPAAGAARRQPRRRRPRRRPPAPRRAPAPARRRRRRRPRRRLPPRPRRGAGRGATRRPGARSRRRAASSASAAAPTRCRFRSPARRGCRRCR